MPVEKQTSFLSSDGVHQIAVTLWQPDHSPRAVVQIVHGMCEYAGRYRALGEYLASQGILVCANDHLGHGRTAEPTQDFGFFSDNDGRTYVLSDLKKIGDSLRAAHPTLPHALRQNQN